MIKIMKMLGMQEKNRQKDDNGYACSKESSLNNAINETCRT